ncbi:hypothetical protein ITI46_14360 [Streptomyces oryzae]|uniref:Uncharacterized protein n=1 Tax=Streptomyces oryzae TaxID=1434886 RepID=A0ABS3XBX4_9ACTN|nr:hypothetical protein [Streptomyces oryzae]MBO8192841.1 hypothetical protein [Streptomyces oryzae]
MTTTYLIAAGAAVLLLHGKRRGADLACAIMVTDLAANRYAVHGIQHSDFLAEPGLQRLGAFGAFVLVITPFLRKHLLGSPGRGE